MGKRAAFSIATASGEERVIVGIDDQGRLTARLYKATVTGPKLKRGSRHSLLIRVHSHRKKPDELLVQLGSPGKIPTEPENWTLSNTKGGSLANLSRVVLHSATGDSAGFENVRVAPTREALEKAKVVAGEVEDADVIVYGGTLDAFSKSNGRQPAEYSWESRPFKSLTRSDQLTIAIFNGFQCNPIACLRPWPQSITSLHTQPIQLLSQTSCSSAISTSTLTNVWKTLHSSENSSTIASPVVRLAGNWSRFLYC